MCPRPFPDIARRSSARPSASHSPPLVEKLAHRHASGLDVSTSVCFMQKRASSRCASRLVPRTECHLWRSLPEKSRPRYRTTAHDDFPRLRMWPFIALNAFPRLQSVCGAPRSGSFVSCFPGDNGYLTARANSPLISPEHAQSSAMTLHQGKPQYWRPACSSLGNSTRIGGLRRFDTEEDLFFRHPRAGWLVYPC